MNIYKKLNEIIVSANGCPDGWEDLGSDPLVTADNARYVTGFANGKAVFDNVRIMSDTKKYLDDEETKRKDAIKSKLEIIDRRKVRAMTDAILTNNKVSLQELEDEAIALRFGL